MERPPIDIDRREFLKQAPKVLLGILAGSIGPGRLFGKSDIKDQKMESQESPKGWLVPFEQQVAPYMFKVYDSETNKNYYLYPKDKNTYGEALYSAGLLPQMFLITECPLPPNEFFKYKQNQQTKPDQTAYPEELVNRLLSLAEKQFPKGLTRNAKDRPDQTTFLAKVSSALDQWKSQRPNIKDDPDALKTLTYMLGRSTIARYEVFTLMPELDNLSTKFWLEVNNFFIEASKKNKDIDEIKEEFKVFFQTLLTNNPNFLKSANLIANKTELQANFTSNVLSLIKNLIPEESKNTLKEHLDEFFLLKHYPQDVLTYGLDDHTFVTDKIKEKLSKIKNLFKQANLPKATYKYWLAYIKESSEEIALTRIQQDLLSQKIEQREQKVTEILNYPHLASMCWEMGQTAHTIKVAQEDFVSYLNSNFFYKRLLAWRQKNNPDEPEEEARSWAQSRQATLLQKVKTATTYVSANPLYNKDEEVLYINGFAHLGRSVAYISPSDFFNVYSTTIHELAHAMLKPEPEIIDFLNSIDTVLESDSDIYMNSPIEKYAYLFQFAVMLQKAGIFPEDFSKIEETHINQAIKYLNTYQDNPGWELYKTGDVINLLNSLASL